MKEAYEGKTMQISVLIADDHRSFRKSLKAALECEESIRVVGDAENGARAVEACERLKPDLVLMDILMPEMSGFAACRLIKQLHEETRVLMLSMHLKEAYVKEALKAGASGYVLKDDAMNELVSAIAAVAGGERYLSPKLAGVILRRWLGNGDGDRVAFDFLSLREREVLWLVSERKHPGEIADALGLSHKAIENHLASIVRQLDDHEMPALVSLAVRSSISNT